MTIKWGLSFGAPSAWGASFGSDQAEAGPYVVLIPHENIYFRTRGDLALFALASFTKQEALRVREHYQRPMGERRVPVHL